MCGRFTLNEQPTHLAAALQATLGEFADWQPSFNLAPTDTIPVFIQSAKGGDEPVRRLEPARWGLVPGWSKELKTKFPTFNARSEDLATKATWRGPLKQHRAIVPMSGWYEWTGEKGSKIPHFIHHPDGELLGAAGLYSWWRDHSKDDDDPDRWVLTATILTSDAVDELIGIHDRSPVPLPRELWEWWTDPAATGDQIMVDRAIEAALPIAHDLVEYAVRPIRSATVDGPELIEPA